MESYQERRAGVKFVTINTISDRIEYRDWSLPKTNPLTMNNILFIFLNATIINSSKIINYGIKNKQ